MKGTALKISACLFAVVTGMIAIAILLHVKSIKELSPALMEEDHRVEETLSVYEDWKKRYVKAADEGYYISYNSSHDTVSEAHGYGMLIFAAMADHDSSARQHFDGMFQYFKSFPSSENSALMAWKQVRGSDGRMEDMQPEKTSSAADGDMDIALSLLIADQKWGSREIDYKQEALQIIEALMESVVDQEDWILLLGDWADKGDMQYRKATRSSDWMPGHFYAFYQATGDSRWMNVYEKTIAIMQDLYEKHSPATALMPDFAAKEEELFLPVEAQFLESPYDGDYYYNACRYPWRAAAGLAVKEDERLRSMITKLNEWMKKETGGNPESILAGYRLDGTPVSSHSDLAFTAPFTAAAYAVEGDSSWHQDLWNTVADENYEGNYYDETIRLLVMLQISGLDNHDDLF
ncbi:beta-glucanase [Bacillus lacus]|uniref:Beta-glucanase n=1 Tax=Metabacillus lacus TaxID=1983721 RepID=A0A7X2IZB2_9BACI|nr:glycosyl hydrolase family 8 [Metabacillus lacus]MRX72460.1 beta-glucanase [Metabacillus lacus]